MRILEHWHSYEKITLDIIFTVLGFTVYSQKCEPCDLGERVTITENIQKYTYAEIQDFLCTFNEICANNEGFKKVSNERLFEIIIAFSGVFTQVMEQLSETKQDLILEQMKDPLGEVDLELVRSKLRRLQNDTPILDKEINAIEIALKETSR